MTAHIPFAQTARLQLWSLALGLWLAITAATGGALWYLRGDLLAAQKRELRFFSLALTEEVLSSLDGVRAGLLAVRDEWEGAGDRTLAATDADTLRARAGLMTGVLALWVLDSRGAVIAATDGRDAPELMSFLPAPPSLGPGAIAISRPFAGPAPHAKQFALALRVPDGPVRGGGWLVAAIPANKLLGAFAVAMPAADARMSVFRKDGVRLTGTEPGPYSTDEETRARSLADRPDISVKRFDDGRDHLVTLSHVRNYGLSILVSRQLDVMLVYWRRAAQFAALGLAVLLVASVTSVSLVLRANRRQAHAQAALDAQRARAGKLEALGTMAGGVAHDVNNMLAGIVGYTEMAQDRATPGSAQARHLERVLQSALHGKVMVERVLSFSRGGARESTVFELEPVIEEALEIAATTLPDGILLERALQAPGSKLRGSPTQAYEAAINLVRNAIQASTEGGRGVVRLQAVRVKTPRVLSHSVLPGGDWLALSVADEGGGISATSMENLFVPFYTTRAQSGGTGLGLAVVHGAVTEFGGAIDVRSEPGAGATFTLYFPSCTEELQRPPESAGPVPAAHAARVGVIDDDPSLVELYSEMLRKMGCEPQGFCDPVEALRAICADPKQFRAVITDEMMPVLSGTGIAAAMRERCPELPVLLLTGYGGALLAERAARAGIARVLTKPVQYSELAAALAPLLAGHEAEHP